MGKIKKEIKLFAIIMVIVSIVFNGLIIKNGGVLEENMLSAVILMFSPAITAIIVSLIYNKNLKELGFKLPKIKDMGIGYLIPLTYIFIAYTFAILTGIVRVDSSFPFNMNLIQLFINPILLMILVIGEDIGWQGFLLNKLTQIMSFKKASFIVGIAWALFHYPMLIFGSYNQFGTPTLLAVVNFTILIMIANFIMNYLRMKTLSIWPAVILHAAHNSFLQDLHQEFIVNDISKYFISETGILLPIVALAIGYLFYKTNKNDSLFSEKRA